MHYRLFFNGFGAGLSSRRLPLCWVLRENLSILAIFWVFWQIFIKSKSVKKLKKSGKELRFSLKTQHRGSLRPLKPVPKPLKKTWRTVSPPPAVRLWCVWGGCLKRVKIQYSKYLGLTYVSSSAPLPPPPMDFLGPPLPPPSPRPAESQETAPSVSSNCSCYAQMYNYVIRQTFYNWQQTCIFLHIKNLYNM